MEWNGSPRTDVKIPYGPMGVRKSIERLPFACGPSSHPPYKPTTTLHATNYDEEAVSTSINKDYRGGVWLPHLPSADSAERHERASRLFLR